MEIEEIIQKELSKLKYTEQQYSDWQAFEIVLQDMKLIDTNTDKARMQPPVEFLLLP